MLYSIIKKLQSESKSTIKLEILREYVDYDLLKVFICKTLNPRFNYFCSEKTFPNFDTCGELELDVDNLEYITKELADRNITGDNSKLFIKKFGEALNKEQQEILKYVLLKDFRANVGEGLVSKVWSDFNWKPSYMRCSLPNAVKLSEWDWKNGVYSQLKCDGMFSSITDKQAITRNGSTFPFDLLPTSFKKEMRNIPDGVTLNGELLVKRNGVTLSRKEGNGMLNSLLQGTPLQDDCELHYVAWDIEDYSLPYTDRFIEVLAICDGEYFNHVEYKMVYSLEQATQHFKEMLSQGQEGTVLKNPNGMWKDGTSKDCVKYKVEAELDMKVVGVVEGTGKYKGMLGALQLESECGLVKTDCGTGFSDKQRKVMLDNPPKIVAIKANDLVDSKSKEGYSLFLPVFLEERVDKSVADNIDRIREIFDSEKDM